MEDIKKLWGPVFFEGIILTICGLGAIAFPGLLAFGIERILAWVLLIGGIIQAVRSFWVPQWSGVFGSLLGGLCFITVGLIILTYPLTGVMTLGFLIMILFLVDGVSKVIAAFTTRISEARTLYLITAVLELILAGMIWQGWPSSAPWVIGTFIGISLMFYGLSQMYIALQVKNM